MERRLQGAVLDGRRLLLLTADGGRRIQSVSLGLPGVGVDRRGRCEADLHAPVPGVRTAEAHSHGQRCAFATNTLARLSTLSAWWVRLGILPELIEPGRPAQNGRHERMHRTLKAETTRPPAGNIAAQQRRFTVFREEFNHERPHEALDDETPGVCYTPSPRPMPDRVPPLEYPDRFETRYVSANGGIRWNSRWVNVSTVCAGEYVGLEEIADGIWSVYFGPLRLGRFHERLMRIEDEYGSLYRQRHV